MGVAYVVIALLLLSVGAARSAAGIPIQILLSLYLGCGLLVGSIAGILAPLAKWRLGAVCIGFLAAVPAAWIILRVTAQPSDQRFGILGPTLIAAAALGGGFGWRLWEPIGSHQKPPR